MHFEEKYFNFTTGYQSNLYIIAKQIEKKKNKKDYKMHNVENLGAFFQTCKVHIQH